VSQSVLPRVIFPNVIGHRGAAAHAPENTLASFSKAKELGAPWVELDIQLSIDGVPMVFHDDGLERTSNGQGRLVDQPASALSGLDAGSWFDPAFAGQNIPTLEQALHHIAKLGLGVNLEIKADEARGARTAQAALAVAQSVWPENFSAPLISSFAESALLAAKAAAPHWPRALLCEQVPTDWQERLKKLDCVSLNTDFRQLSAGLAFAVKEAGYGLLAYTVNHPGQAQRLWAWGVDGLFSDCPDRIMSDHASPFAERLQSLYI